MIRAALLVGVFGALFCASAVADVNVPAAPMPEPTAVPGTPGIPGREDVRFFCTFNSDVKGGENCRAFGQFDRKKLEEDDHGALDDNHGDRDDFLKIVCGDGDMDGDDGVIYNDGIRVRVRPDSDDFDHRADVEISGTLIGSIRSINVEELDLRRITGEYRSTLTVGIPGQTPNRITGRCEFRRSGDGEGH